MRSLDEILAEVKQEVADQEALARLTLNDYIVGWGSVGGETDDYLSGRRWNHPER